MLLDSILFHPLIKCPVSFKDMENKIKEQSLKQESMQEGSSSIENVVEAIEAKSAKVTDNTIISKGDK